MLNKFYTNVTKRGGKVRVGKLCITFTANKQIDTPQNQKAPLGVWSKEKTTPKINGCKLLSTAVTRPTFKFHGAFPSKNYMKQTKNIK